MHKPRNTSARRALPPRCDRRRGSLRAGGALRSTARAPRQAPSAERRTAKRSPHILDTAPRQLKTTTAVMLTDDATPVGHVAGGRLPRRRQFVRFRDPAVARSTPGATDGRRQLADTGRTLLAPRRRQRRHPPYTPAHEGAIRSAKRPRHVAA